MPHRSHASVSRSLHAAQLAEILSDWVHLHGVTPPDHASIVALAARTDAHRGRLLADNAALQAAAHEGDEDADLQIACNQLAIKTCTVMLGEMTALVGHTLAGAGTSGYASRHEAV